MNNLFKSLLIAVVSIYIAGCGFLQQSSEAEHIKPLKDVSLSLGESVIVNGAMEHCGREARSWSVVSPRLPYSETGFFSNAGRNLMKTEKCTGLANVLAIRFTANKVGTENLTVLGDPLTVVVSNNVNFLQSGLPNPKKAAEPEVTAGTSTPGTSIFGTIKQWIDRDVK